jgi:predicted nucleic acid-binding protein
VIGEPGAFEQVSKTAALIKCERALALGDCYALATAKATGSKALFVWVEVWVLLPDRPP